jgi:hypothetical protein
VEALEVVVDVERPVRRDLVVARARGIECRVVDRRAAEARAQRLAPRFEGDGRMERREQEA